MTESNLELKTQAHIQTLVEANAIHDIQAYKAIDTWVLRIVVRGLDVYGLRVQRGSERTFRTLDGLASTLFGMGVTEFSVYHDFPPTT